MARPEPQIDDIDPETRQPKYAGYDEYYAALRKWDREDLKHKIKRETSCLHVYTFAC
jgi:hypothetical protein